MPGAETFRASADAYDRVMGRYASQLAGELVAFAGVREGMRVVDVGCGPGALVGVLAERLGASNVRGAEPSPPFAQACRERLPDVDVVVAAAEELPFGTGEFDAALSQLVVNFMADAVAGVREMARVTRQGGVVASCVWHYAGGMTMLRAFWDAAREVEPSAGAAADEGVVMPWCREGELEQLWRRAGLSGLRSGVLEVSVTYQDFDDLWTPFTAGVGPSGAFCASLDDDRRKALRDALRQRLDVDNGSFTLPARAWAVSGIVP